MEILKQLDVFANFVWKDAIVVFAIVWIYEGTRILVAGESKKRGFRALLPGVILMVCMASVSLWVSQSMVSLSNALNLSHTEELPADWGPTLSPDIREKSSRAYASVVFTSSGKLVNYFDQAGNSTLYCPSEKDITLRDQTVVVRAQMQQVSKDAYSSVFRWLVWGVAASLLGWFAGRRKSQTT
jgi:hypothetical protein